MSALLEVRDLDLYYADAQALAAGSAFRKMMLRWRL